MPKFHNIECVGQIKFQRLTTAQRGSTTPSEGRIVFDTDLSQMYYGDGVSWNEIGTGSSSSVISRTVWGWGINGSGQLGFGDITSRSTPTQIGSDINWYKISVGTEHTCFIKTDGSLWSCGANTYGQLGLGNTTKRSSPIQVGSDTTWKEIECNSQETFSIKTNNTLWSWGYNTYGQLGLGDRTHRSSPVQVGSDTTWSKISASEFHTLAIKNDGTLWSWGYNAYGQLGLGDRNNRSSPVQVGNLSTWSEICAGTHHTLAIKNDGTLWSWGYNSDGQLGVLGIWPNLLASRSSPVQVGSNTNWSKISAGWNWSSAIKTTGTLWTWGSNTYGQLGKGNTIPRSSPVQVGALTDWENISAKQLSALAKKTNNTLWSWGNNSDGKLGLGDITNRSSPVQIGSGINWDDISIYNHSVAIIETITTSPSATYYPYIAITSTTDESGALTKTQTGVGTTSGTYNISNFSGATGFDTDQISAIYVRCRVYNGSTNASYSQISCSFPDSSTRVILKAFSTLPPIREGTGAEVMMLVPLNQDTTSITITATCDDAGGIATYEIIGVLQSALTEFIVDMPVGSIIGIAGDSPPSGWKLCNGDAIGRTSFSNLFSVIGTTYGTGDGLNTFNIPDLRGRFPVGENPLGGGGAAPVSYNRLAQGTVRSGTAGGEFEHTLTVSELPSHRHGGAHDQRYQLATNNRRGMNYTTGGYYTSYAGGRPDPTDPNMLTIPGTTDPHPNTPPYQVINYIIKY
jgi:alpha-tubulin suppressor-like RCC1 family protein/microcystin-dependent protein